MTQVPLLTHAKWRTFTQPPLPAAGSAGHMLSLAMESRAAADSSSYFSGSLFLIERLHKAASSLATCPSSN
jgi:hypothetical protein